MDLETQLQFVNVEISECESRKVKLEAVKQSLTDATNVKLASVEIVKTENSNLRIQILEKDAEIKRLEEENGELKN